MSIPEWRNWQTRTTQNREEKSVSVRPRLRGPKHMKSTGKTVLFYTFFLDFLYSILISSNSLGSEFNSRTFSLKNAKA